MSTLLVSILVLLSALSVFAADSETNRSRRSDHIPALQTVEGLSQKLADVTAQQAAQTAQLTALQNKLNSETYRSRRSDDIPALQTVVEGNSQKLTEHTAQLSAQQSKLDALLTSVAFHARHTSDSGFSVASQGTIVYNIVTTNMGNAYDPRTGFFTAPVPGTYVFFINCMAVDSTAENSQIMVEGTPVATCYSYMPHGTTAEQGATMATVHVQAGQKVWVQITENAQNVRGNWWNTFSGFLVRPDV